MPAPKCYSCSRPLRRVSERFWAHIELLADPKPDISSDSLKGNLKEQYEELLQVLKDKDPKLLAEEVYVKYKILLCKCCRDTFNSRIKAREFI